ncbi:MAG: hypothetical protein Q4C50_03320 [Eubacteriales bacterium]|nr:hypothetical protein [Eubacteriales bacterium]
MNFRNTAIGDTARKTEMPDPDYERTEKIERRKQQPSADAGQRILKMRKVAGILEIIFGAILLTGGIAEIEYDWGIISLVAGVGFLVAGILDVRRAQEKTRNIIYIVFGAATAILGAGCDLNFDWGYIGIVIGIAMVTAGILGLLHKTMKTIGIVEIVFGGILIILGGMCIDFSWGTTGFFAGILLLVVGILKVVNNKYEAALRYCRR